MDAARKMCSGTDSAGIRCRNSNMIEQLTMNGMRFRLDTTGDITYCAVGKILMDKINSSDGVVFVHVFIFSEAFDGNGGRTAYNRDSCALGLPTERLVMLEDVIGK